jgi:hypothetical protein
MCAYSQAIRKPRCYRTAIARAFLTALSLAQLNDTALEAVLPFFGQSPTFGPSREGPLRVRSCRGAFSTYRKTFLAIHPHLMSLLRPCPPRPNPLIHSPNRAARRPSSPSSTS